MNREIKFRAWDSTQNRLYACAGFLSGQVLIILSDGHVLGKKDHGFVLQQYTGLKDKNGREIYEGDIYCHDNGYNRIVHTVKWLPNQAGFNLDTRYLANTEVIGNIYENPELTK